MDTDPFEHEHAALILDARLAEYRRNIRRLDPDQLDRLLSIVNTLAWATVVAHELGDPPVL